MKIINKHLDYSKDPGKNNVLIFTGNRFVTKEGALVQGRGAAKEIRDLYPCVQYNLGRVIKECNDKGQNYLITTSHCTGFPIWVFQVKDHFKDKASLELIKASTDCLKEIAECKSNTIFHINFPGIGFGGLSENEVEPILSILPDNVLIYR